MELKEFKYQEKQVKKQLLFENGVHLATRRLKEYQVLLFQVESFYAEVYFDWEEEQIGYIRAFSNTDELAPYLSQINISAIF